MILKVDLEKAYDCLEWAFIEETLTDDGIPNGLVSVIMHLVSSSSCRLLFNGDVTNEIKPSKGLRQGCLLSPYLFMLCMERLGRWPSSKVVEGSLRAAKVSRQGPGLSYLFFVDDFLIFSEAREDQLACIKGELDQFCKRSAC